MARKKIAFLTINPESESLQRIMNGVFLQCAGYDYDVAVISPMVSISHFDKEYLEGELNIFQLVNFDLFDGVIVTPLPMQSDDKTDLVPRIQSILKEKCHVPVVSINMELDDIDVVYSDERTAMKELTEHLLKAHSCRDIAILTGPKDLRVSEERVGGVKDALKNHGIVISPTRIVYGDFWYTSGEELGAKIVSGQFPMPDAVVCTSDHMAIGLTNYLNQHKIWVPEDIIVLGNGGSRESVLNLPPITTFNADESYTGALAVNKLREQLEPKAKLNTVPRAGRENMVIGCTCGCKEDSIKIRQKLRDYMYISNYTDSADRDSSGTSLTTLLESYISEELTATDTVDKCLNKIYDSSYLLKPFSRFYVCLNTNWLNEQKPLVKGYTPTMYLTIDSRQEFLSSKVKDPYREHVFFGRGNENSFSTAEMIPALQEEYEVPQVFYFSPLHFGKVSIGYTVLQNDLNSRIRISSVYRNYLRYIANALEMSRAKSVVRSISEHDQMTGLFNRRGMTRITTAWLKNPDPEKKLLAVMVDMNRLKYLNDNFGHEAGDGGILAIARAVDKSCEPREEIGVRAGGDEFLLLGLGEYTEEAAKKKLTTIRKNLEKINKNKKKIGIPELADKTDIMFSAAMGYGLVDAAEPGALQKALDLADASMYEDKKICHSKEGK